MESYEKLKKQKEEIITKAKKQILERSEINKLELSDHELSVIQTSLQLSIRGFYKYIEMHGEESLPVSDKEAIEDMIKLFERFNKEYF